MAKNLESNARSFSRAGNSSLGKSGCYTAKSWKASGEGWDSCGGLAGGPYTVAFLGHERARLAASCKPIFLESLTVLCGPSICGFVGPVFESPWAHHQMGCYRYGPPSTSRIATAKSRSARSPSPTKVEPCIAAIVFGLRAASSPNSRSVFGV